MIEPSTRLSSDKGNIEQKRQLDVGDKNKIAVDAGNKPREAKQERSISHEDRSPNEKPKNKESFDAWWKDR